MVDKEKVNREKSTEKNAKIILSATFAKKNFLYSARRLIGSHWARSKVITITE